MSTCLVDMEEKLATVEAEKRLVKKYNTELFSFAIQKKAESVCTGNSFIETTLPMYLGLPRHVEKAIVLYCFRNVFMLLLFTLELQRC